MTTKWTPPPWAFDTTRGIYAMRPSVGKNLPFTLATTFKRPTREEEEANGKIMAAAPELAEALADAVVFIALALEDCTETMPDDCAMLERARAALRAAGLEREPPR